MDSGTAGHNYPKQHAATRIQPKMQKTGSARGDMGYTPYGYHPSLQSTLGFNGVRPDAVTQHYLLGNGRRVFNPSLMRFSSPDSMSPFAAGGLNAYAYCLGDPVNRVDPSGNISLFKPFVRFFRNLFSKKKTETFGASQQRPTLDGKVHLRPTLEVKTVTKTYTHVAPNTRINVVDRSDNVPQGFVLRALHGSPNKHEQSLLAGLNSNHIEEGSYGRGAYGSTFIGVASEYTGPDGSIFGFYVHGSMPWVEGVDYEIVNRNVILIRESSFDKVLVSKDIIFPMLISHKGYITR